MVSPSLRPIVIVLGLLLLVGPSLPEPQGVAGQGGSCSDVQAPGDEPALLGGERLVWSFDSATDSGNRFDPFYTGPGLASTGAANGTQPGSYTLETLRMGHAFRVSNGPLEMPKQFRQELGAGDQRSLALLFSYVKGVGVHQTLLDASPSVPGDGGIRIWEDIGDRVVMDIETNGQRVQVFIQDHLQAGICVPHLLVLSYDHDANTLDVYLDGKRLTRVTNSDARWVTSGSVMLGADRDGSDPWRGRVDEARVYDRQIGLAEQMALFNGVYCETNSASCPDVYPPAVVPAIAGTGLGFWYRSDVTIKLPAADAGVGLDKVQYVLSDGTNTTNGTYTAPLVFDRPGTYTLTYNATDLIGNLAPARTISFGIDKTAPTFASWHEPQEGQDCIADFPCGRSRPDGPTLVALKSQQRVEIEVTDPESGIASVAFFLDGQFFGLDDSAPYVAFVNEPPLNRKFSASRDEATVMVLEASIINNAGLRTVIEQDLTWV